MTNRSKLLLVVFVTVICVVNETQSSLTIGGSLPKYYSDAFARYLYWPLTEIPYDNVTEAQACLNQCFFYSFLVNTSTVFCGIGEYLNRDTCTGSIIVSADYKVIILSFKGWSTPHQLEYILDVSALTEPVADPILPIGKINYYYMNAFKRLFVNQTLQKSFATVIKAYPAYNILVVGDSLGGALSTIASAYIRLNYPQVVASQIHVATFGSLIVGDTEFAENFSQLVPHNQRIVHADDPIPRIATNLLIYGTNDSAYLHVQGDTWYNNTMEVFADYEVCPGLYHYGDCTYAYNFSDITAPENVASHYNYFDAENRCSLCNWTLNLATLPA